MRKDKTSSLKPLWMPHANCFIVHILNVRWSPFFLPAAATNKNSCFTRCCTVDRYLRHSNADTDESRKRGLEGPRTTHSPPSQLAPVRSLKLPSPQTSERRWRPDETCSSSPRPLSSTVWFPAQGKGWRKRTVFTNVTVYPVPIHESLRPCQ